MKPNKNSINKILKDIKEVQNKVNELMYEINEESLIYLVNADNYLGHAYNSVNQIKK